MKSSEHSDAREIAKEIRVRRTVLATCVVRFEITEKAHSSGLVGFRGTRISNSPTNGTGSQRF
jgi:hypothetical protein